MPQHVCMRHGKGHPCSCGMGNLYRFVEPVVLFLLMKKERSYGYDLLAEMESGALTDSAIEKGALYRTLRQLEINGNVKSEWETESCGPARRVYTLTKAGKRHLEEWLVVLEHLSNSMNRFVSEARLTIGVKGNPNQSELSR
jgi:PadR family transcriptional regulator, regulatory protein PadR